MKLQVTGTSFDIKNYTNQDRWETVLLTGSVAVTVNKTQEQFALIPNQKLSFHKNTEVYELISVEGNEPIIWIQDKLVFKNERLADIFRKMEYWFNIDIICEPDVWLDHRLHLTIRKENPEEIFKLLKLIAPIDYKIQDEIIHIYKK